MYPEREKILAETPGFIIVDLILFELAYFLAVFVRNRKIPEFQK